MKKVLIAGGLCGTTMLRAAELIKDVGNEHDLDIDVTVHDLWASSLEDLSYDLIIEMFPYFEDVNCPLISGKPFISRIKEKDLIKSIMAILESDSQ